MALIFGNNKFNTLTGTSASDQLWGLEGNDVLNGGTGADTLYGGADNDRLIGGVDGSLDLIFGGSGIDTVDYSGSTRGLSVTLGEGTTDGSTVAYSFQTRGTFPGGSTYTFTVPAVAEETLNSIENVIGSEVKDFITGNSDTNRLEGRGGDDVIDGGAGNDTIIGGLGADDLTGGQGSDLFVFTNCLDSGFEYAPRSGGGMNVINYAIDLILDFETGVDRIDLSQIDANTLQAGNQAFHLVDEFSGQAGELRLWEASDYSSTQPINENFFILTGDVNGDGYEDFHLVVQASPTSLVLVNPSTDFIL